MKRFLCVFLCLLLCVACLPVAAFGEDCFVIDVDSLDMNSLNDNAYVDANLSAQTQGLRVVKYISDSSELAAQVRLTIMQAETSDVVFDKYYGYVSGTFDSGVIYLPYVDNNTIPYLITLDIEDWTYAIPFMHLRPRLIRNGACTYGLRLRDQNPSLTDSWMMGTMLDLNALRSQGGCAVPLCASNLYVVGQANLALQSDRLTVSLSFAGEADVEVLFSAVYLFPSVSAFTTADPSGIPQPAGAVGQALDVSGVQTALLYIPLLLNYNPSGLSKFQYDPGSAELSAQIALWQQNLQADVAAAEPAVTPEAFTAILEGAVTPETLSESVCTPDGAPTPAGPDETQAVPVP